MFASIYTIHVENSCEIPHVSKKIQLALRNVFTPTSIAFSRKGDMNNTPLSLLSALQFLQQLDLKTVSTRFISCFKYTQKKLQTKKRRSIKRSPKRRHQNTFLIP